MIDVTIGLKRLYRPEGITHLEGEPFDLSERLSDGKTLRIYFGASPPFGRMVFNRLPAFSFVGDTVSAPEFQDTPDELLFEVSVSWVVSATMEEVTKAYANDFSLLIARVDAEKDTATNALDAFCGGAGLALQMQLVVNPIVESKFAIAVGGIQQQFTSSSSLVLHRFPLPNSAESRLRLIARRMGKLPDLKAVGSAMHWLLKVWQEKNDIARFMYMFIPLEALLPKAKPPHDLDKSFDELIYLIKAGDPEKRKRLTALVESGRRSVVSVADRFSVLAAKHAGPGWEEDIELFKRFNRIRNELLHRGIKDVFESAEIKEEARRLAALVEKYIRLEYLWM